MNSRYTPTTTYDGGKCNLAFDRWRLVGIVRFSRIDEEEDEGVGARVPGSGGEDMVVGKGKTR